MKAMLSVLVSPKATFERIRDQGGHFAAPFIAILLIAVIAVLLSMPLLEYQTEQVQRTMGEVAVDPGFGMTLVTATSAVGAAVGTAASIFIGGLLLMIINLIVRGEAKYMQLVKVSMFSGIPELIQGLIVGVLAHVIEPADLTGMTFSLADLLESPDGFVKGLAALVNPFTIWGLSLMVIGTSVMARKGGKQTALWLVAGWLLLQLAFIWIGTLFSGFGNM